MMKKLFLFAFAAFVLSACSDEQEGVKPDVPVDEVISFEAAEKMMGVDGREVALGTIAVVTDKVTDSYSNVYWAKAYTEAEQIKDQFNQLYYAGPFFSTADGQIWFSSYYCDSKLYGAQYDTWGGFVLSSNARQSSSGGLLNQFEAYAEGGAGGSEVFAACYDIRSAGMAMAAEYARPQIDFTGDAREVLSVELANSVWTYNYFGGGEGDSFVVAITGQRDGVETGVVECPLVSGAQKVDSWKKFDLAALGKVDCLIFAVKSNDPFAPCYFCVDNIILKK